MMTMMTMMMTKVMMSDNDYICPPGASGKVDMACVNTGGASLSDQLKINFLHHLLLLFIVIIIIIIIIIVIIIIMNHNHMACVNTGGASLSDQLKIISLHHLLLLLINIIMNHT